MADSEVVRIPWRPIEPLSAEDQLANGSFGALDALRQEWERRSSALTDEERVRIQQRSLRRLSVETGILERLYDVEWGLTLTLVAEGFTRDVVERAGGKVDDRTLATLRAQLDSLGLVLDFSTPGAEPDAIVHQGAAPGNHPYPGHVHRDGRSRSSR